MSVVLLTYTLPIDKELLRDYAAKVPAWVKTTLSARGAKEFRAYRSSDGKEVLTITEHESVGTSQAFLASDGYKALRQEMEKAGCRNIHVNTWETSPLVPKPIHASAAAA